jgi:hypothetical protein
MLPEFEFDPGVPDAGEQGFIQALVAQLAIKAFDEGVLCRLARCDVMPVDLALLRLFQDHHAGELSAVIADNRLRLATPSDNDIEFPRNTGP